MKKGIVALLVVLALIVLISPGIVGRIAEKSVDENLSWAAQENEEIVITSERFDRGWFSSEGQHRIEIRDPAIREILIGLFGERAGKDYPVFVIDTRLDHGLIPVASMSREEGSLAPGLGNAVSTLELHFANGEIFPIPGTVFSAVGLTGAVSSRYVAEAGSHDAVDGRAEWGPATIEIGTDPSAGEVTFDGSIDSFLILADGNELRLGRTEFDGVQRPSEFGISVGEASLDLASIAVEEPGLDLQEFGPFQFKGSSVVDDDRINGDLLMSLAGVPVPGYGEMALVVDATFEGLDGLATSELAAAMQQLDGQLSQQQQLAYLEEPLIGLIIAGFKLNIERFDFTMPQGPITSQISVDLPPSTEDPFTWTSVLLDLDARFDMQVGADFVDFAMATNPQAGALVGMGYLQRNGDIYEMQAEYTKGLLTVNGAPMPIPLPAATR